MPQQPELNFSLMGDGPSDKALIPIIKWALEHVGVEIAIQAQFADLLKFPNPPSGLAERITAAVEYYPCNILFIHRDAEKQEPQLRFDEIREAVETVGLTHPFVCVVPVRMTEAWLLQDENAIRSAASNPNGRARLNLPPVDRIERLPDAKAMLHDLLKVASGRTGRRARQFRIGHAATQVPHYMTNFDALNLLASFQVFLADLREAVAVNGWGAAAQN